VIDKLHTPVILTPGMCSCCPQYKRYMDLKAATDLVAKRKSVF